MAEAAKDGATAQSAVEAPAAPAGGAHSWRRCWVCGELLAPGERLVHKGVCARTRKTAQQKGYRRRAQLRAGRYEPD